MEGKITWTLARIRFTSGGKGLYKDNDNHNIYMNKTEMQILGDPEHVDVVVTATKKGGA